MYKTFFNNITHNSHHINRYFRIIDYYINNPITVGDIHHIVPRSFGGSNSRSNLVRLPVRIHFIAHLILSKAFTSIYKQKAHYALWIIMNGNKSYKVKNSKIYLSVRTLVQEQNSLRTKGKTTVKDATGKVYRLPINDPRVMSGEFIHINQGRIRSESMKSANRIAHLGKTLSNASITKRTNNIKKFSPCFYILNGIRYEFDYLYDCWKFIAPLDSSLSDNCKNYSHNFYTYLKHKKRTHCGLTQSSKHISPSVPLASLLF